MARQIPRSWWILALLAIACVGCGKDSSGPTPEELARRQQLRDSAQIASSQSPAERLARAQAYLKDGNPLEAQKELRPLMISSPEDVGVLILSAKCKAALGDKAGACEIVRSLPEDTSQASLATSLLASKWLSESQDHDEAERVLRKILERAGDQAFPEVDQAHRLLAAHLNNQGRRIEAAEHLRALAKRGTIREKELVAMNCYAEVFIDHTMPKPDFASQIAPGALGEAKRLRSESDLSKSLALVQQLNRAFPNSTPISAFLGKVYSELQRDTELDQWLSTTPDNIEREPEYWYALGLLMQRRNQHPEAARCFAEAMLRDETDRLSYQGLAHSLIQMNQPDAAERINNRFQLLVEAAGMSKAMGYEAPTVEMIERMATILDALDRPWEAIAWRSIAAKGNRSKQPSEAAQKSRELLSATDQPAGVEKLFASAGVQLEQLPLPSLDTARRENMPQPDSSFEGTANHPLQLVDVATSVGLAFEYDNGDDRSDDQELLHQITGGGIGVVDFDLDGSMDLYFAQAAGDAFSRNGGKPNRLFRNMAGQGWLSVEEPTGTDDRGYGQGVAVCDLNQDGFPDILVANIGTNILFWNNGDGTFRRQELPSAKPGGSWTTSIACGDLSGDARPEIVEVNYIDDPTALQIACSPSRDECNPSVFRPALDYVWQLTETGAIVPWAGCDEIASKRNYGFAAVIANIDQRHGNDVFVANDSKQNHYWLSQGSDTSTEFRLSEVAQPYGCAFGLLGQSQGCMGIASGDFDRNGLLDLHVTNFWNQASDLYLQDTLGLFRNEAVARGIYEQTRLTVAWGTQAIDFDRDGWLDLAILNGNVVDHRARGRLYRMKPQLFRGTATGFVEAAFGDDSHDYWSTPALGRAMAIIDWNNDRKPDLVTNHLDSPAALLENRTEAKHWLQFELVGTTSERDAIGAKVTVIAGEQRWTGWSVGGGGFLCANEPVIDFGIGEFDTVDRVIIDWPSGISEEHASVLANHRYTIVEGESNLFTRN